MDLGTSPIRPWEGDPTCSGSTLFCRTEICQLNDPLLLGEIRTYWTVRMRPALDDNLYDGNRVHSNLNNHAEDDSQSQSKVAGSEALVKEPCHPGPRDHSRSHSCVRLARWHLYKDGESHLLAAKRNQTSMPGPSLPASDRKSVSQAPSWNCSGQYLHFRPRVGMPT